MYSKHLSLRTPAGKARLWRYLDLSEFLWLLFARALYFACLTEFDDKWEGKLTAATVEALKHAVYIPHIMQSQEETSEERALLLLRKSMRATQLIYGISCWHLNDVESVAMWKLYTHGKDGVAIQTTVSRLKDCLSHEPRTIFIGEVNYDDHEACDPATVTDMSSLRRQYFQPLATKRRSFRHESEVRVILERMRGKGRDEFNGLLDSKSGESISVDLPTLIERIVVAPDYPRWAIESLQQQVSAAGLQIKIETSDLLRTPDSE